MANSIGIGGNINRWTGQPYSEKRKKLAIWQHRDEFLNAFRANQVLALVAQSGSGKSTQIPQFVLDDITSSDVCSKMMIACTQPQKVAVISVSHRVAEEMGVPIGEEVGYKNKFEDCTSSRTVLKYIKDDMLLKEAMTDPLLQCYKVIIIDDIQERTLSTDLLLGYLSQLLTKRPDDLKLVFMTSTSFESEKFKCFFQQHYPSIHIMKVPERLHHPPVEIVYSTHNEELNYLEAVIKTVVNIHRHEPHGDVLVFLSQEEEVEDACHKISKEISKLGDLVGPIKLVPLYSCLPPTMQHKIHEETCSGRKIVVTTDIVESSLTIDGISYVVDSGLVKKRVFDPKLHMESLVMSPISKASADMRSEHAGRSTTSDRRKGKCFRLYTEESYNNLDLETCPEILRLNLANMILSLWKLVDDFWFFGYVDFPDVDSLVCAFATLVHLGALDQDCNLTNIGEIMSMFPLEPQMSKMLLVSPQFKCLEEILSISSMLSVPNCFVGSREEQKEVKAKFHNIHGDHLTLLNIYRAYKQNNEDLSWCNDNFINYWALKEADNIRQELACIMMAKFKVNICSTDNNNSINIRKSILAGYFMNMAHLDTTGNYITLEGNKVVNFNPSSNGLDDHKPEWVIFNAFDATDYNFIRTVTTPIPWDWLFDSAAPWSMYYQLSKFSNSEAKIILERLGAYVSYERMLKERKLADGKLGKHANISTFHRLLPYHNNRKRKQRI